MPHHVVRIQVVQTVLTDAFVKPGNFGLLNVRKTDAILSQIKASKAIAERARSQLIVFPELSLPDDPRFRADLCRWTARHSVVAVAGTYYKQVQKGPRPTFTPTSPIFIAGDAHEASKCQLSPHEQPLHDRIRLIGGQDIQIFRNTPVGTLAIAICSDVFTADLRKTLESNNVHILCVPAMQRNPDLHHRTLADLARHTPDGIYIVYANALWASASGGGSGIFAQVDRHLKPLLAENGFEVGELNEHVLAIPKAGRNLVVEVDIDNRRPSQTRTVHDIPQFRAIAKDFVRSKVGSRYVFGDSPDQLQPPRIVCFDADGTLTTGVTFSWRLLWSDTLGAEGESVRVALRDEYEAAVAHSPQDRRRAYAEWCRRCCDEFRKAGLTRRRVVALAKTTRPVRNLRNTLDFIKHTLNCRLVLISGGIDVFTMAAIGEDVWNMFDRRYINRMAFSESDDHLIEHIRPTEFDFEGKYEAITTEALEVGCPLTQVAFIGDELNDRSALSQLKLDGGIAIAFGRDTALSKEEVSHRIMSDDLADILPVLSPRNYKSRKVRGRRVLNEFQIVYESLKHWVSSCERQAEPFPDSHLLFHVNHDAHHRARVMDIVGRILESVRGLSEQGETLMHVARCAVLTHDIGLFLPISPLYPDAAIYGISIRAELRRLRHHSLAGHALKQIAGGTLPHIMARDILHVYEERGSVAAERCDAILRDTLHLLAQLTWFHDANESHLIDTYKPLEDACEACTVIRVSPGAMQLVRAAVRMADRLDRSHRRLKSRTLAEDICLRVRNGAIDDLPGVLRDSVSVCDREVISNDGGVIRVRHQRARFRNEKAQEVADSLFQDRVLARTGPDAPWYSRFLGERFGIRVVPIEHSSSTSAKCSMRFAIPSKKHRLLSNTWAGSLTQAYGDLLASSGMNSWVRSIPIPFVLCGGLPSQIALADEISRGQSALVFDEREWSANSDAKLRVVRTSDLVEGYLERGGRLRHIKGVMAAEQANEWDIYVKCVDPATMQPCAILNCHLPKDLNWNEDQAFAYGTRVKSDIEPFEARVCGIVLQQLTSCRNEALIAGAEFPQIGTTDWYRIFLTLESVDLLAEAINVWPASSIKVRPSSRMLFSDMSSVNARVGSRDILRRALECLRAATEDLENVVVEVDRCSDVPACKLSLKGAIAPHMAQIAAVFDGVRKLSASAELYVSEEQVAAVVGANEPREKLDLLRGFFNSMRGNGCDYTCRLEADVICTNVCIEVLFLVARHF